jgi:hypothetical protein
MDRLSPARTLDMVIQLVDNSSVHPTLLTVYNQSIGTVGSSDVSTGSLNLSINLVKVSGTLTMQVNGSPHPISILLQDPITHDPVGYTSCYVSAAEPSVWSITMEAQNPSRQLDLVIPWEGVTVYQQTITVGASDVNVGQLDISPNIVHVGGTLNLQVKGSPYEGGLDIRLLDHDTGDIVQSAWASTSGAGNASWSFTMEKQTPARQLDVVIYLNGSIKLYENTITVGTADVNIGHVNLSPNLVQVSGTLTVQVDGSPHQGQVHVSLYDSATDNYVGSVGSCYADDLGYAAWSILMEGQNPARQLYLRVRIEQNNQAIYFSEQPIITVGSTDVNAGHFNFSSVLASGQVSAGTVTQGGSPINGSPGSGSSQYFLCIFDHLPCGPPGRC